MRLTPRHTVTLSVVLAAILSACSPNPAVLQDRVYGSRATPAPAPAKTATAKPAASAEPKAAPAPTVSTVVVNKPVQTPPPASTQAAAVSVAPSEPAATVAAPSVAPSKAYKSSSAVQALVRQSDAEVAKGNLDKAADTLERALRIEADNPDLWMKLAKINEQQGKHEQALSMVGKAQAYREQLN